MRDLVWTSEDRSSSRLRIVGSKANQFGDPEWVPFEAFGEASVIHFMRKYAARHALDSKDPAAPLFPIRPSDPQCMAPMSKALFVARFRMLVGRTTHPAEEFTGHSFRSGGATDLFHGDCRPHTIRLQGRWLSDAIFIYIRDCPLKRSHEVGRTFARAYEVARQA